MNVPYGTAQIASRIGDGCACSQSCKVVPSAKPNQRESSARRSQMWRRAGVTPMSFTKRIAS